MDIEINLTDDRFFADVAPVVDRKGFSDEIKRIRLAIGIETPLSKEELPKFSKIALLEKEVEKSRKRLYLPVVFKRVIEKAVLCGIISDGDYLPAYLDSTLDTFDAHGNKVDETFFIVLSPNVRDNDVLNALWEYRTQTGSEKGAPEYKYINPIWKTDKKKPSIRQYRKWYLSIIAGKTFPDICSEEYENCPIEEKHESEKKKPKECTHYSESTIRKGVDTYKSLIWKTPTF